MEKQRFHANVYKQDTGCFSGIGTCIQKAVNFSTKCEIASEKQKTAVADAV